MSRNQPPYGHSNEQQPYGPPTYGQPAYGQRSAPLAPGAPWAAAPMRRPGTVTAGSVMAFVGGGFMVIIGLLLAALGSSSDLTGAIAETYGPAFASMVTVLGIVLALVGALIVFFGVMAFKGRRWGAIALAVITGLSLIGTISDIASGTGSSVFGLAWSIIATVLLLVSPSQAWYRAQQR